MKFLLTQILILVVSVGFLLYLLSLEYFLPITGNAIDWYNVASVMLLTSLVAEAFVSLVVFLVQKFTVYGKGEFPKPGGSLKWGIGVAVCLVISLLLGIYSIIPFIYGFGILVIILIILNLIFT